MAPPVCMTGDGNPARFIGTYLDSGETVSVCDECMVPWMAAMLQAMTGVDATPFLQAISEDDSIPSEGSGNSGAEIDSAVSAPPDAAREPGGAETPPADAAGDGFEDPPPPRGRRGRLSRESLEAGTDADPDAAESASTTDGSARAA